MRFIRKGCRRRLLPAVAFVFLFSRALVIIAGVACTSNGAAAANVRYGPPCDSYVYCYGPLLHAIQMAGIYPDSKTFVDMRMKYGEEMTLRRFNEMLNETNNAPTRQHYLDFLNKNFEREGTEFEVWVPPDWIQEPKFFNAIKDPEYRNWAVELNKLWKFLGRKIKDEIKSNQHLSSIIFVPNAVVVPGGRFREFYYWDSYWIMKGLLLSEMYLTVRGMLENFLHMVHSLGHVPNGGRVYYSMRSQPPFLTPMMHLYVEHTDDFDFVTKNIHLLDKEFNFWMNNRTLKIEKDGKHYTLARFKDESSGPRPESYREDYEAAQMFAEEGERENFYNELKSAAESGWDFSSRWFIRNATNKGNLTNLATSQIIPVDLNSFIHWNAKILANFYKRMGNAEMTMKYEKISRDWLEAVTKILWHEEVGAWLDYDIRNEVKRDYFYPSNIIPLFTGCFDAEKTDYYASKVLKYLEKTQIMQNRGGVPTTFEHSGEQWDYPNSWAPLQQMMVLGLDNTGDSWAQDVAFEIAERWTRSNWIAYNATKSMFEKYDASVEGGHGGGGEYEVQVGFGWSNGVIMEFLYKYGDRLSSQEDPPMAEIFSGASKPGSENLFQVVAFATALVMLFHYHPDWLSICYYFAIMTRGGNHE